MRDDFSDGIGTGEEVGKGVGSSGIGGGEGFALGEFAIEVEIEEDGPAFEEGFSG